MHGTEIQASRQVDWRQSLARAVRDVDELCLRLRLPDEFRASARLACQDFPLLVPESYLRRIQPGDPRDPLLLQVLPTHFEQDRRPGFELDPVGDLAARRGPGLIHKYQGRVLLIVTGACAVHCRYCFRRHYPYAEDARGLEHLAPALATIAADATIREVILSGGDPLVRGNAWLETLAHSLADIAHVETLRVHTRLPIVLPDRIDEGLVALLTGTRLQPIVVLHSNHANELAGDCVEAIAMLRQAGIVLLNQSVLLRGVNDDVQTLEELCRRLGSLGVLPYYLHQLDRVLGAGHFESREDAGVLLVEELRRRLPGYLVPRYVRESPGLPAKSPIS